jgi:hypothetical protein
MTFEPHDRDVFCPADGSDHELEVVAEKARALPEAARDIRPRLDLHLAANAVGRTHDPNDEVVVANTAYGGTDFARASASASGRGPPSLVSRFRG